MATPHFLIRRSRSGRFNFTLLSVHGRITGVVNVPTTGRSRAEIEGEAHEKIRALAGVLDHVVQPNDESGRGPVPEPCSSMMAVYN